MRRRTQSPSCRRCERENVLWCGQVTTHVMKVPTYVWTSAGLVVLVALVAGLAKASETSTKTAPDAIAKQLIESAKTALTAARQDANMVQKLADAINGLAYISSAKMLTSSDGNLEELTRINVRDLQAMLRSEQQEAQDALALV